MIAPSFFPDSRLIEGRPNWGLLQKAFAVLFSVPLVLFFNGCSSTSPSSASDSTLAAAPLPPIFLTGPVASLLTNIGGFSAHLVMSNNSHMTVEKTISGELLGREGQLLFAAEPGKAEKKRGSFIFISDVGTGQGIVMSEALQGYAPAAARVGPTNLTIRPGGASGHKVDNHVCEIEEATVDMSDGSRTSYQVWRAIDLKRFPISIISRSNATFTLSFSNIKLESPPAKLFAPPKDFTKYESTEVMLTELIMRQQNLRRHPSQATDQIYDPKIRK